MEQPDACIPAGRGVETVGLELWQPGAAGASAVVWIAGDDGADRRSEDVRAHGADEPNRLVLAAVVHRSLGRHDESDAVRESHRPGPAAGGADLRADHGRAT